MPEHKVEIGGGGPLRVGTPRAQRRLAQQVTIGHTDGTLTIDGVQQPWKVDPGSVRVEPAQYRLEGVRVTLTLIAGRATVDANRATLTIDDRPFPWYITDDGPQIGERPRIVTERRAPAGSPYVVLVTVTLIADDVVQNWDQAQEVKPGG
ncbi:hypothetical protein AB0L97_32830 [Nocardia sp. NPDC051911]|uniref:hypothetical protein n=1 Tax=Nocardia sp. NPDC051911 TaxID=3154648 RepID=UPI003429EC7A